MRSVIAIVSCIVILAFVDVAIFAKERLLDGGRVVYLELAPVDPRSLMQGDYMALRFRIANDARPAMQGIDAPGARRFFGRGDLATADGRIVAALDSRLIANYRRLDDGRPLAADELVLRYRVRGGTIKFATNAFFFQEGTGGRYTGAHYGEFRVAADGELLLTGLRGRELEPL